jgi:hypothetical protein
MTCVICHNCGERVEIPGNVSVLQSEQNAGRDFAIVFLTHMGATDKAIGNAFGVKGGTIQQRRLRLFKKWGPDSDFFECRRRKSGKRFLSGFYRGGEWYDVRGWFYDSPTAYAEIGFSGKKITDLSDWAKAGFYFD